MKRTLFTAAAIAALTTAAYGASLNEADTAYEVNRVPEAERLYSEVAADATANPEDRNAALIGLARIDWLMRGETDAAAAALHSVTAPSRCSAVTIAVRIFREAGAPATPLPSVEPARTDCTPGQADDLRAQLARTHMALASATPEQRDAELARAQAELDAAAPIAAGDPDVASARFALAIMRRDASAAFTAWRDYYWLTDGDAPQALVGYADRVRAVFDAGLAVNASDASHITLVTMLVRAGFIDDARLFAEEVQLASRAGGDPDWIRASSFFDFNRSIRDITLAANREMIAGRSAPNYERDIRAALGQLMENNGLSGDPRVALAETFGMFGSLGETGGYPSLHGGHIAEDRTIVADQYGHRGELRFVVIDNMVSNGFQSWLWDGSAQAGGWAGDGVIVQVRSAYTAGPLARLRMTRPGPGRDRYLQQIERSTAGELQALGRNGVAMLPATSARLHNQVYEAMGARFTDDDAFIAEVWRSTNQYSIDMHEGRHAIDKARGNFTGEQLEFMAKLSQIALADYPRLGLASVAGQAQGDDSHGNANRRVLTGYRDWMRRHASEIPGFDRTKPALTQLTLLSDAQIVAIAQGMDPLVQEQRRRRR